MTELYDRGYFHEHTGYLISARKDDDGFYKLEVRAPGTPIAVTYCMRREQMEWLGRDCLRTVAK